MSWRIRAACAHSSVLPERFVDSDASPAECFAICRSCPVRAECSDMALEHPGHVGVMGATTAPQRVWIRANSTAAVDVTSECAAAGVCVDELTDWYLAVGPEHLSKDDAALTEHEAAVRFGVPLNVLHGWLTERDILPRRPAGRRGKSRVAGPWFEEIRNYLERLAASAPGEWVPQTRLADRLAVTVEASVIENVQYYLKRGPRATWTRYAHHVVEAGLRDGWMEQRPDPDRPHRKQVRFRIDQAFPVEV